MTEKKKKTTSETPAAETAKKAAPKTAKPAKKPVAAAKKTAAAKPPATDGAVKPAKKSSKAGGSADGPALVVVESPAKERTISKMLGSGYTVKSSYGHVRDLPERELGVDEEKDFKPTYVLLKRKRDILPELRRAAQKASQVFLATDHDREGESIAWHLVEALELPADKIRRITFTEITPQAIRDAVREPRSLDMSLVNAQQARRVLDRLVGYKLSPLLWQKVQPGLSAGRVQSVAVRLIVERAKEIEAFSSEAYFTLSVKVEKPGSPPPFAARLTHWKGEKIESTKVYQLFAEEYRVRLTSFKDKAAIDDAAGALAKAAYKVASVEAKTVSRRPAAPFSTSTLQQQASQKLGFAAERTMRLAQGLYEGVSLEGETVGLITYMRTDSFNVAKVAQEEAKRFVDSEYGAAYAPETPPTYATKSRGAQEAHEAIRPTSVYRRPDSLKAYLEPDQLKLYDLIWKRFVASQMSDAQFDTLTVDVTASDAADAELGRFRATGRTLKFEGFLKVYMEEEDEPQAEDSAALPVLAAGDALSLLGMDPEEHKTSPPPHYNEASLIKALEKNGIGRPSTYAPIIKTIVDRGYVRRGLKDKKLQPTTLGSIVTEKLKGHFPEVVDLAFTAGVEERLDEVAEGQKVWHVVVRDFYDPFARDLSEAYKTMTSAFAEPQATEEKCPRCSSPMLLRESRFGKYLSCTKFPKCRGKVQLGPDGKPVVPEDSGETCDLCGKPMVIRMGRRGRFLACTGYPACRNAYSLDADGNKIVTSRPITTDRPCGKCGSPLWLRTGKRGPFLACSAYPKCRNIVSVSREDVEKIRAAAGVPSPQAPPAPPTPPAS